MPFHLVMYCTVQQIFTENKPVGLGDDCPYIQTNPVVEFKSNATRPSTPSQLADGDEHQ
jgi:hypothetical protein